MNITVFIIVCRPIATEIFIFCCFSANDFQFRDRGPSRRTARFGVLARFAIPQGPIRVCSTARRPPLPHIPVLRGIWPSMAVSERSEARAGEYPGVGHTPPCNDRSTVYNPIYCEFIQG